MPRGNTSTHRTIFFLLVGGIGLSLCSLLGGCSAYPQRDWAGSPSYFGDTVDAEYSLWLGMQQHISSPAGPAPLAEQCRVSLAKQLCKKAYALPTDYDARDEWRTPGETERRGGVCLDKSIWLISAMRRAGLENMRLVLGVHHGEWRDASHAWVQWCAGEKTYLLDPSEDGGFMCSISWFCARYEPSKSFQGHQVWTHGQQPDTLVQAARLRSQRKVQPKQLKRSARVGPE